MLNIEQLAKKHLYTTPGDPYWEAAGYQQFAQDIINYCCSYVNHIQVSGGETIGDLIRKGIQYEVR